MWWIGLVMAASYNTEEIDLQVSHSDRASLLSHLTRVCRERSITTVPSLAELPRDALMGVLVAVSGSDTAAEYDLAIDKSFVTVIQHPGAWSVSQAPAVFPRPDATRVGLEDVHLDGPTWEPEVLVALKVALGRLSPAQRKRLAPIRWVRKPAADSALAHGGRHAATYVAENERVSIEIYDVALVPSTRFVGTFEQPYTQLDLTLLHEIAHALSDESTRLKSEAFERKRKAHAEQVDRHTAFVKALNQRIGQYNRKPSNDEKQAISRQTEEAERWAAALDRTAREMEELRVDIEQLGAVAPLSLRFQNEVGGSPTRYGRTHPDEAFAEAFALHLLDPEALERVQPGAGAWFRKAVP